MNWWALHTFDHETEGWDMRYVTMKISRIRDPSQKIAMIDSAFPYGVPDSCWHPQWQGVSGGKARTLLSVHHQKNDEQYLNLRAGSDNVLFVDGHCDLFPRQLSTEWRYDDMQR